MMTDRMLISQFTRFPQLTGFCTTRDGGMSKGLYGSFNQSPYSGDVPEHYLHNRQTLCNMIGITPEQLIIPYQTHDDRLLIVDEAFLSLTPDARAQRLKGVDGLITRLNGICIGITTADCVPLTFYDQKQEIIAAVHAGWRGTCKRIAEKTITTLATHFGSRPEDVFVEIGPSISQANYQVGEELLLQFSANGFPVSRIFGRQDGKLYLDLWEANRWLLAACGIPPAHINIAGLCTYANHHRFFSARRLGIQSGRMLSGIMKM